MTKPQFSYNRLVSGKAIVTCTCGWRDPLGPMPVSPFDPAEALVAAQAEHPVCTTQPVNITEQTTLAELAAQRELLGITCMMLFIDLDGSRRSAIVQHPQRGTFSGEGITEAEAIEKAFSALRRATLPPELREILDAPAPEKP